MKISKLLLFLNEFFALSSLVYLSIIHETVNTPDTFKEESFLLIFNFLNLSIVVIQFILVILISSIQYNDLTF